MPTPKGGKEKSAAQIAEEAYKCYQLKLTGANHRQIAEVVGISISTVNTRISKFIAERIAPGAEEYRKVIIDRAERLLLKCEQGIKDGDPKAIANAMRLLDALFRYNGLESIKIDHTVIEVTQVDIELRSMISEMKAKNALVSDELARILDQS